MSQFKVPQNVQRADTIVGPLTMTGLIIAIVGGGFAYTLFLYVQQPVGPVLGTIVVGITLAFALIRMHDMSFAAFIVAMTLYMLKPRLRVWEKGSGDLPLFDRFDLRPIKVEVKKEEKKSQLPVKKFTSLHELTQVLDTEGQADDMDAASDEELVHTAFKVNTPNKKQ